jgi:hypothetical protein
MTTCHATSLTTVAPAKIVAQITPQVKAGHTFNLLVCILKNWLCLVTPYLIQDRRFYNKITRSVDKNTIAIKTMWLDRYVNQVPTHRVENMIVPKVISVSEALSLSPDDTSDELRSTSWWINGSRICSLRISMRSRSSSRAKCISPLAIL